MNEDSSANTAGHCQIEFTSKQKLPVPSTAFSIENSASSDELNSLLNQLLADASKSPWIPTEFDFLISGTLLRVSLKEFIEEHGLDTENVIQVECVLKEPAPTPEFDLPHEDWVSAVRGSSSCIISGCYDTSLHVWSRRTGSHVLTIPGHTGPVKCLSWVGQCEQSASPSLRFVSGSQDQTLMVWDYEVETNRVSCVQVYKGHERSVECVCSNEDGSRIASGGFDSFLKIWNADNETEGDSGGVGPGEKETKRRKTDGTVITKTPMVTLSGHREAVTAVSWSQSREDVITASWDHSIIVWDLELAGQKNSLTGNKAFTSLASSPLSGLLITGSVDKHVRLWDPRSKEGSMVKQMFTSHSGWVTDVAWSRTRDNLFVSSSYDQLLKLWDTRSPKAPLYDLTGHSDRILCCDWSVPELLMSGGVDCAVKCFKSASA